MSRPPIQSTKAVQSLRVLLRTAVLPHPSDGWDPQHCERIQSLHQQLLESLEAALSALPDAIEENNASAAQRESHTKLDLHTTDSNSCTNNSTFDSNANKRRPALPKASSLMCSSQAPRPSANPHEHTHAPQQKKTVATVPKPVPRPRTPSASLAAPNKPAERPVPLTTPTKFLQPIGTRDRSTEWTLSVRWWNLPLVVAASVVFAVAAGWWAQHSIRAGIAMTTLSHLLDQSELDEAQVRRLCSQLAQSPVARWHAERDYLFARAALRLQESTAAIAQQSAEEPLRRAISKAPTVLWFQLSRLSNSDAGGTPDAIRDLAQTVQNEPAATEVVATLWDRAGDNREAIKAWRRALALDPNRTGAVVNRLIEQRKPLEDVLAVVPDDPRALWELTKIVQPWNENAVRKEIELKLTRTESPAPNPPVLGLAAAPTPDVESAAERVRAWLADPVSTKSVQSIRAN